MAKSEENFLTLENALLKKGLDPLVYRFAALHTHYRKPMEYSEEVMANAASGYAHLKNQIKELGISDQGLGKIDKDFQGKYINCINDDLNMPQAMAVVQELLKSDLPKAERLATVLDFDKVLGLRLDSAGEEIELPPAVRELLKARDLAREAKDFGRADEIRQQIEDLGYTIEDTAGGVRVCKKS